VLLATAYFWAGSAGLLPDAVGMPTVAAVSAQTRGEHS